MDLRQFTIFFSSFFVITMAVASIIFTSSCCFLSLELDGFPITLLSAQWIPSMFSLYTLLYIRSYSYHRLNLQMPLFQVPQFYQASYLLSELQTSFLVS